ncbi:MAG TPA: hypothetical protein VK557_15120 [Pyrinomonadaceae bacterium]|nr:hypothetical protein [Pyrinomonadaceae bacterium]
MEIKHLLKSQANEVFEMITALGLEPSDFEWQTVKGYVTTYQVSELVHRSSGYYFMFDNAGDRFFSKWSPGKETLSQTLEAGSWLAQCKLVAAWLSYLKRETHSPDLWEQISTEARVLESAASSDSTNDSFTADEKAYIVQGIQEIKQFLLTAHKVDPELVEARLNYLIESSERVGRKDWINLLISVLVGIVINAALPPETTRELFRFVGTVLRQIINMPLLLT